jgi:hypothetical protein
VILLPFVNFSQVYRWLDFTYDLLRWLLLDIDLLTWRAWPSLHRRGPNSQAPYPQQHCCIIITKYANGHTNFDFRTAISFPKRQPSSPHIFKLLDCAVAATRSYWHNSAAFFANTVEFYFLNRHSSLVCDTCRWHNNKQPSSRRWDDTWCHSWQCRSGLRLRRTDDDSSTDTQERDEFGERGEERC